MSLSFEGIAKLTSKILSCFNAKTIDKIAGGGCSNLSENFWGVNTKFSEGKRLNFDHTDAYISCNKLTFCRIGTGNIEKTHDDVSAWLGLRLTSPECLYLTPAGKKRAREKLRQTSDAYTQSRVFAELSKDHRMGKVDARKLHRPGKVPLTETAKSNCTGPWKVATCSICKQIGHRSNGRRMPPDSKCRVTDLGEFDSELLTLVDNTNIKPAKRRKQLDLLSIDDWM